MNRLQKQKTRSDIHLLNAFKDVFKREHKTASGTKKKSLEKKIRNATLAIELKKASISEKRKEKQTKIPKRCVACGNPTTNKSGFCNSYTGSMFGCKESWKQDYDSMPTQKELGAKWRSYSKSELREIQNDDN